MKKYNKLFFWAFTMVLCLTAGTAFAQVGPGAPPATPIDGGLSALLAAGGIYAVKKLKLFGKKEK